MKIIFVGGVHGVGKTSLCSDVAADMHIEHYVAGDLIKNESKETPLLGDKSVSNVTKNQNILISAIERLRSRINDEVIILDGHFTIRNKMGTLENVEQNVFEEMDVAAFVLVTAPISVIAARIRQRDGRELQISEIQLHQKAETAHAKHLAHAMRLPFIQRERPTKHIFRDDMSSLIANLKR